jgi:hypothetical protein
MSAINSNSENMKNLLLPILLFLISCETVVTPELPDEPQRLVVYSFFRPDQPIRFDVFKTASILGSPDPLPQRNLSIALYQDDQLVETLLHNDEDTYLSTLLAKPGATYRFEIQTANGVVSGESTVPSAVAIDQATFSSEIQDINLGEFGYPASITFSDPADEVNYYALEVFVNQCQEGCAESETFGELNEVLIEEVKVNTSGNTTITISEGANGIEGLRYIYFSDNGFDGETISLDFYIIPTLIDPDKAAEYTVQYVLKSIPEAYYEYLLTSDYQRRIQEEGTLAEPVQIYTNVQNGLGVFAGYDISVHRMVLGE